MSRRFGNFHNYPKDIQRMIDNNDSRYAFQWLKDGYKEIALENLEAPWSVGEKVEKVEKVDEEE